MIFAMQGNWDGYTDEDMLRPGHDVDNILIEAQRALDQHLEYCARRLAAKDLQLAQLHSARLRHSARRHRRLRPDLRPARLLGRGRRARATTPALPLRICFSTTGTRWCRWSRSSPACMDSPSATSGRSISRRWPSPRLPATLRDVTFDNVKYGQTRVTSDARAAAGGQRAAPRSRSFAPAPAPVASFTVEPAGLCARTEGQLHRATRARRALHLAVRRRNPEPPAAACAIASPTRSGPNSTAKTALAASGFCFMSRTSPATRTGPRRALWPSRNGMTL